MDDMYWSVKGHIREVRVVFPPGSAFGAITTVRELDVVVDVPSDVRNEKYIARTALDEMGVDANVGHLIDSGQVRVREAGTDTIVRLTGKTSTLL